MKSKLAACFTVFAALATNAFASGPWYAPGIPLSNVVEILEFRGRPGNDYSTEAAVVDRDGRLSLVIVEKREGLPGALIAVDNPNLDLTHNNYRLATNAPGSLLLTQAARTLDGSEQRTLTIAYRDNSYILAGFTLKVFNLSGREVPQLSCDYNLLNHRGVWGGQAVTLRQDPPLDVREIRENRYISECRGWVAN